MRAVLVPSGMSGAIMAWRARAPHSRPDPTYPVSTQARGSPSDAHVGSGRARSGASRRQDVTMTVARTVCPRPVDQPGSGGSQRNPLVSHALPSLDVALKVT